LACKSFGKSSKTTPVLPNLDNPSGSAA
jgi:hypothetical protein